MLFVLKFMQTVAQCIVSCSRSHTEASSPCRVGDVPHGHRDLLRGVVSDSLRNDSTRENHMVLANLMIFEDMHEI